jgi:magnesium chelatase subunit D
VTADDDTPLSAWAQSVEAARLFAVDPVGLGHCLKARAGPQRERWLAMIKALMPDRPIRKIPLSITDDRLLGGLDLAGTLASGSPVLERGVLAGAHDGAIIIPSAERMTSGLAARIAAAHDRGEVSLQRDGFHDCLPARFGMIVLDESLEDGEAPPAALMDRIAFRCDLSSVAFGDIDAPDDQLAEEIITARIRLPKVTVSDEAIEALCAGAAAFGITSARAPILALRAARAAAALAGRDTVEQGDLLLAARLTFSWRATAIPQADEEPDQQDDAPEPETDRDGDENEPPDVTDPGELADILLDAIRASLPPDLLARLIGSRTNGAPSSLSGRSGALRKSGKRGRRIGSMHGDPRNGARLDVLATLRAAAPWQKIRMQTASELSRQDTRLRIRPNDFRTIRFAERRETLTIFAVDASGSLALNRLAETKGAVELLLADCYIRRDQVALIAFRGKEAELILRPTRSLLLAKRSLSGLPGGGGTPMASGIDASAALAQSALRRGQTPLIVFLTDGRANIARDGAAGRPAARDDALVSAKILSRFAIRSLLIDTSPRAEPQAEQLAAAMGAVYLVLPHVNAGAISGAVRSVWTNAGTQMHG